LCALLDCGSVLRWAYVLAHWLGRLSRRTRTNQGAHQLLRLAVVGGSGSDGIIPLSRNRLDRAAGVVAGWVFYWSPLLAPPYPARILLLVMMLLVSSAYPIASIVGTRKADT